MLEGFWYGNEKYSSDEGQSNNKTVESTPTEEMSIEG